MKINIDSIKDIIGPDCKEVMVYGLSSAGWIEISDTLESEKIKAYEFGSTAIKTLSFPGFNNIAEMCKATITNLIAENAQRIADDRPIIPLIFSVGKEGNKKPTILDIEKIASSHSFWQITDKELRRCYRIHAETSGPIKEIADKTFKFVKLSAPHHDVTKKACVYSMEAVKPFWENERWGQYWAKRQEGKQEQAEKQQSTQSTSDLALYKKKLASWRQELEKAVSDINPPVEKIPNHLSFANSSAGMFNQSEKNTQSSVPSIENAPGLRMS